MNSEVVIKRQFVFSNNENEPKKFVLNLDFDGVEKPKNIHLITLSSSNFRGYKHGYKLLEKLAIGDCFDCPNPLYPSNNYDIQLYGFYSMNGNSKLNNFDYKDGFKIQFTIPNVNEYTFEVTYQF